jgi:hypothetical protein
MKATLSKNCTIIRFLTLNTAPDYNNAQRLTEAYNKLPLKWDEHKTVSHLNLSYGPGLKRRVNKKRKGICDSNSNCILDFINPQTHALLIMKQNEMIVNWLKKFGSFTVLTIAFCFLFSTSFSSCASKSQETETGAEATEQQVEGSVDQPEHPAGGEGQEHPNSEDEDENSRKKEAKEEHPTGDDEHPN